LIQKALLFIGKTFDRFGVTTYGELSDCGAKVIRWDGNIVEGLPEQHKPENVVRKLFEIFSSLPQSK